MPTPNRPKSQNKYSTQDTINSSFDEDLGVNTQQPLGYDGQNLQRMNASNPKIKHYSDSTYDYFCFAAPGTSLSTAKWLIKRVTSDGSVDYPSGSIQFAFAATDLTTVQGYSYS